MAPIHSKNLIPQPLRQDIISPNTRVSPLPNISSQGALANLGMVIRVSNIPSQVSCDELSFYFSAFGTLQTVETPRPRPNEAPTAYLSFSKFEPVSPSIFTTPHQIEGVPISIDISSKKELIEVLNSEPDFPPDSRTILLNNLPIDIQSQDLEDFFESKNLGIESIRISNQIKTTKKMKSALVTFKNRKFLRKISKNKKTLKFKNHKIEINFLASRHKTYQIQHQKNHISEPGSNSVYNISDESSMIGNLSLKTELYRDIKKNRRKRDLKRKMTAGKRRREHNRVKKEARVTQKYRIAPLPSPRYSQCTDSRHGNQYKTLPSEPRRYRDLQDDQESTIFNVEQEVNTLITIKYLGILYTHRQVETPFRNDGL